MKENKMKCEYNNQKMRRKQGSGLINKINDAIPGLMLFGGMIGGGIASEKISGSVGMYIFGISVICALGYS